MMTFKEIWVDVFIKVLDEEYNAQEAAQIADQALDEYKRRFEKLHEDGIKAELKADIITTKLVVDHSFNTCPDPNCNIHHIPKAPKANH